MSDFGARLKQAREERGVSLRQIAAVTKISVVALEALERNDLSRLPGGIFGRSFVRAYAIEIGLDPDQTLRDFRIEYEQHQQAAAVRPVPEVTADDRAFLERQRRASRWLRGILAAVGLGLLATAIHWRIGSRAPAPPPSQPTRNAAPAATGGVSTTGAQAEAPAKAAGPPVSSGAPASTPLSEARDAGAGTASVPLAPASAAKTAPGADEIVVRLQVSGDCWVRAVVDGAVALEKIMAAGESQQLPPGQAVSLQVGNAGVVTWSINGRPGRELGKLGQIGSARITRATMSTYLQ